MPTSGSFMADLRETLYDLNKHSSASHKRMVLLLLLAGIALRASLLWRPISFEEASAFVQFTTKGIGTIVADHAHPTNHILHTLLAKFSTTLFGTSVLSLRLPAFTAGVLVMPLFYLFVRAQFNRYIALLALALVAASGPLVEYSAIARGYSLTWFFYVSALLLGRHMVKMNNPTSAVLIGVCCGFGLWAGTSLIYACISVYVWLLLSLTLNYENSIRPRMATLLLSFLVFVALSFMLYLPVIQAHGFDQLMHHSSFPFLTWKEFTQQYEDLVLPLWAYLVDSSATGLALVGLVGLLHAAFISSKYRALAFATLVGSVPLVLVQRLVGPPEHWLYILFVVHLSSAIAVFYLLKFIQEKVVKDLGKRSRTILAAWALFGSFAVLGMRTAWQRSVGMPEAERCVEYAQEELGPGGKIFAESPWDVAIEFHLRAANMDPAMTYGTVEDDATILIATGTDPEQTVASVLRHNGQVPERWPAARMVQEWPKLKIFAAP